MSQIGQDLYNMVVLTTKYYNDNNINVFYCVHLTRFCYVYPQKPAGGSIISTYN